MVWIHGGAYLGGSNNGGLHDGGSLAWAENVVVVAVNYRLGAFGSSHLPELLGPDTPTRPTSHFSMFEALRWVRRNIAAFRRGSWKRHQVFGRFHQCSGRGYLAGHASVGRAVSPCDHAKRHRRTVQVDAGIRCCGPAIPGPLQLEASRAGDLLKLPAGRLLEAQKLLVDAEAERDFGVPLPFTPTVGGPPRCRPVLSTQSATGAALQWTC